MKRYELLLADADETLFDFPAAERAALREVLLAFDIPTDEATCARYHDINHRLWQMLERGAVTPERLRLQRFEEFMAVLGLSRDAQAMSAAFIQALGGQAIPLPGAEAAVARWAARVPVIIVTNGLAAVQRARLAKSPMGAYLTGLVISEEVGAAKPDPRIVEAALALAPGVPRARALLLGDSLSADMAAAANAGIAGCWYNPTGAPLSGTRRPTHTIQSLDEVDALLQ